MSDFNPSPSALTKDSTFDEIMDQWIKDLRSGEFDQGEGFLELVQTDGTHKFCCLGVLSYRAAEAGVCIRKVDLEYTPSAGCMTAVYLSGDGKPMDRAFLPPKVAEWSGVGDRSGKFGDGPSDTLVSLNDNHHSFEIIANVIDDHRSELIARNDRSGWR